ncbi:MAG: sensor histidine kinase [Lachnospiraceae bacterium]
MNRLKTWFANLKLQYKLMLSMAGVTSLALLAIITTTYQNYFSTNFAAEMEKSDQAVTHATKSLHSTLSSLTLKTSRILLDPMMKQVIIEMEQGNATNYGSNYQSVSAILDSYVSSFDTLISAYLFNPSILYGTVSAGPSQNPYNIIDETLWATGNITYKPYNLNERTQTSHVIPLLFPLTSISTTNGQLLNYGISEHHQPVFFAAFLDERYLNETLSRFSTNMTDSFFLLTKEGLPLNQNFGTLTAETLTEISQYALSQEELHNAALPLQGDTFYISCRPLGIGSLKIVHIFSKSSIMRSIQPMLLFLVLIWLLGIAVSCLLSFIIAHSLTRPFRKLTTVIDQINLGVYTEKAEFLYKDESGLLGKQINHMYDTIQQQILLIKQEEQQKARAEIQMYSEQVNPHFLYNTLECIHFQMLNDHKEAACLMLSSLGKYLRLTLSHGQNTILLAREIEHVTEYMTIINRHSATEKIAFNCTCDDSLRNIQILKLLLQPLTENAIKHGFPQDLSSYMIPPAITINITREGSCLHLKVTDNGQGFDTAYAGACMRDSIFENGTHFGLHNIYQRLTTYYGSRANLRFESIPYYRNSVTILIPVDDILY